MCVEGKMNYNFLCDNTGRFQLSTYMKELIEYTHSSALKMQFLPHISEKKMEFLDDYLMENTYMPIPNLVHRYKTKVIIIATNQCACYCQFCTRQRIMQAEDLSLNNLDQIVRYIMEHDEIKDVLITGGDPLTLSNNKLFHILQEINKINTVKIVRLGTRIPITNPRRIDTALLNGLKKFQPLYINIHINHPDELTAESKAAILSLANIGIPLGSQSVLLKGINDDFDILKQLFEELTYIKVKPYYLYQCDKVRGCEDFIVDIKKGIEIINRLCNQTSGFAVPKYVVDTPEKGKMVLAPCSISNIKKTMVYLTAYNGQCTYENIADSNFSKEEIK